MFRITEFPPVTPEVEALEHSAVAAALGAIPAGDIANKHPFMHRTNSVDYAIVLSGEIDMLLDDTEVRVKAGGRDRPEGHQPRLGPIAAPSPAASLSS